MTRRLAARWQAYRRWRYAKRRAFDLAFIWPMCKYHRPTLVEARAFFAGHALHDTAWLALGHDEVERIIEGLQ